jgi:hypothetical protein
VRSLAANWLIARFNNLKIINPDGAVSNGQETRWSLDYEFAPIQFAQIRGDFIELHGYFQAGDCSGSRNEE